MKNASRDYIFDLSNTWELNLDLIENLSKAYTLNNPNFTEISLITSKLKLLFNKKNEKRQKLVNLRGKLLIDKQIIEEFKRKIEENSDLYKEQIKEMEENVDNKEEYIKIFEKKLKEVEIYVQKHTKTLVNTKYDIYKNFRMNEFINENTEFLKRRDLIKDENNLIIKQLEEIGLDNKELNTLNTIQDRNHENKIDENNKINNLKNNSKIQNIMNQYNNQIKKIEARNKLLRSKLSNLKQKCLNSIIYNFLFSK